MTTTGEIWVTVDTRQRRTSGTGYARDISGHASYFYRQASQFIDCYKRQVVGFPRPSDSSTAPHPPPAESR
jgi:hypothetical protein